ncbi:hypothetical protein BIW11_10368 [Tropilaelaps mercedesae]|uniref:Uncharacterized protein n=1 Tax=Tropilaelaps mercedesae TaxID=418985 RepID=A0A1V9XFX9_9ACAR|nr:hypothetical protein BIW11_10368 [Tropilaelaps mercedesae]
MGKATSGTTKKATAASATEAVIQQQQSQQPKKVTHARGVPDYKWRLGTIKMIRLRKKDVDETKSEMDKKKKSSSDDKSSVFSSVGHVLKPK